MGVAVATGDVVEVADRRVEEEDDSVVEEKEAFCATARAGKKALASSRDDEDMARYSKNRSRAGEAGIQRERGTKGRERRLRRSPRTPVGEAGLREAELCLAQLSYQAGSTGRNDGRWKRSKAKRKSKDSSDVSPFRFCDSHLFACTSRSTALPPHLHQQQALVATFSPHLLLLSSRCRHPPRSNTTHPCQMSSKTERQC